MTTTLERPSAPSGPPRLRETSPRSKRRKRYSQIAAVVLFGTVLAAVTPLVLLLWQVTMHGAPAIGMEFFTQIEPLSYRESGGGYLHGIVGTLYMTGSAALISVPLGIGAAVYLTEYGRNRFATTVRFFTDVMTGVPSVFVGLAVYTLIVTSNGGLGLGFGTIAGAAALSIIMLPIVVRSCEEMLLQVPSELKAASYALGARQWQTLVRVTLPTAAPGLTTGSLLAVARGAGETAPLILTALGAREVVWSLWGAPQADVGLLMKDGFTQPFEAGIERAWAGGFSLILIVLVVSVAAKLIARRSQV